ncbi:GNAT family N-acetyltransferase [Lacisediminihabitans changchengi]|uniref:GNAT family N-acetyltransferase n=1 Tax=Lacisediminihabitans changchengi TaxID=2787634 RepID=A0A934SIA4_9MICO|nr:GNAT family N-acetyltransferase [Lacisediminihabitans changchengi]MBK4346108.1 GNAT family N-acetyltransferase [Lacisediminihabitans changchengi]
MSELTIRDLRDTDVDAWSELYRGYRAFYLLADDDAIVQRTWGWLQAREYGLRGIVAEDEHGELVALAHLRLFARPSSGALGLYLDDLFTSADARGRGVGGRMLERCAELATESGATIVRWITAVDNTTARSLYDAKGRATSWVTYEMDAAFVG